VLGWEGLNVGRNESRTRGRTNEKAQAGQRLLGEVVEGHGYHWLVVDANSHRIGRLWVAQCLFEAGKEPVVIVPICEVEGIRNIL
jgi:hypothetical protein